MKNINRSLLLLILFLQTDFLSIPRVSGVVLVWNSYSSKYLSLLIIFILLIVNFIYSIFRRPIRQEIKTKRYFDVPILILLFFVIMLIFISCRKYQQPLFSSITASYYFFILIFYFVLRKYFNDESSMNFITEATIYTGTIYSAVLIVQGFVYSKGIELLNIGINGLRVEDSAFLFNIVRIKAPADFISFTIVIILIKILTSHRHRYSLWCYLAINLVYIIVVSQTRVYILIDLALAGIVILLLISNISYRLSIFSTLVIICIAIFISASLFTSFTVGSRQMSYSVRLDAIKFFLSEVPKGTLFGIGFPNTVMNTGLLHGDLLTILGYQYYLDDVGIIGFYTIFGWASILVVLLFTISFIRSFLNSEHRSIIFLILFYVIATSTTLLLLNVQRILYLPLLLFIANYNFRNGFKSKYRYLRRDNALYS